jgi:hypothetical protein
MRAKALRESVKQFLRVHRDWCQSEEELLTVDYESAMAEMVNAFATGDIPGELRAVATAVARLSLEWDLFESYVTLISPRPRDSFWGAVENLAHAELDVATLLPPKLESVAELLRQKVSVRQIAEHIYGHNGEGPFLKNGIPQEDLILKEAAKPGSVIPEDWVHPEFLARLRADQLEFDRQMRVLNDKVERSYVAPESIEELLRQKVPGEQIAAMKQVSIQEVQEVADRLGLVVTHRENLATFRAPHEPPILPEQAAALDAYVGGNSEDDDELPSDLASANRTAVNATEQQVLELSESGESLKSIAEQLGLPISTVAKILKRSREAAEVPA